MTDSTQSDRIQQTLQRIATALQCTVDDLKGGDDRLVACTETEELLLLWSRIRSDDGRRMVLATARQIATARTGSAAP